MLYRAFAQFLEIVLRNDVLEVLCREILRRPGREVQRRRLQREGTDRVVWAVITTHFVDGQKLDDLESNLRRPINKLTQGLQIADPQIGLRPQRKKRRQHSGDLLIGREIHERMTNGE